jgi:hypothetical protein
MLSISLNSEVIEWNVRQAINISPLCGCFSYRLLLSLVRKTFSEVPLVWRGDCSLEDDSRSDESGNQRWMRCREK